MDHFAHRKAVSENELAMKTDQIEFNVADSPTSRSLSLTDGQFVSTRPLHTATVHRAKDCDLTLEHRPGIDASTQTEITPMCDISNPEDASPVVRHSLSNDDPLETGQQSEIVDASSHSISGDSLAHSGNVYIVTAKDWDKMRNLRPYIWSLRSKLQELRNELRQKETQKSLADDRLIQVLRGYLLNDPVSLQAHSENKRTMSKLHDECEQIRSSYGPVEMECISLEDELGTQEYILQKLEAKVDVTPEETNGKNNSTRVAKSLSTSSEFSTPEPTYHPLVTEYLSKMGDVDILQERIDWHLDEKADLEEEKARRQRVGLSLPAPDQAWLDQYESALGELTGKLNREQGLADTLRARCYSMGLVDDEGEPTDFQAREEQTFQADLHGVKEASGYVKFPTLIPPPNGLQVQLRESDSEDDTNITSRSRVNHWLLHQLRMSALDVNLFAETFKIVTGNNLEAGNWQNHVLSQWYQDDAGDWPSAPRTSNSQSSSNAVTPHHQQAIYPEVFPIASSRKSSTVSDGFELTIRDLSPSRSRSSPASLRYRYRNS